MREVTDPLDSRMQTSGDFLEMLSARQARYSQVKTTGFAVRPLPRTQRGNAKCNNLNNSQLKYDKSTNDQQKEKKREKHRSSKEREKPFITTHRRHVHISAALDSSGPMSQSRTPIPSFPPLAPYIIASRPVCSGTHIETNPHDRGETTNCSEKRRRPLALGVRAPGIAWRD